MAKRKKVKRDKVHQELIQEYKKKAHKANQRLRELEKLAQNPDYEDILKMAYHAAERDIKQLGVGDITKVRYRIPKNTNKLKSAMKRVDAFLSMPTSAKTTIDIVYKEGASNFNKAFNTNMTWQEIRQFTKASNWNQLKKDHGSAKLQLAIKNFQQKKINAEKLKKQIKEENEKHKTIKEDLVLNEIQKNLENEGLRFDMLQFSNDFKPVQQDELPDEFID